MQLTHNAPKSFWHEPSFLSGFFFLFLYWWLGYDGITFTDDVTYLEFGKSFWSGEPFPDDSLFGHRWGAYLVSGWLTYLFGFSDRIGSLASLLFVYATFTLLYREVAGQKERIWFTLFFCSHVFLLHFINKVYPDTLLAFWICLLVVSLSKRHQYPLAMAILAAVCFIVGFSTKELMVYMIPMPVLLFIIDWKSKNKLTYHAYFALSSFLVLLIYFVSYQLIMGDFLARFRTLDEGYYISEYTFADKEAKVMLARLTYLPLVTFVERSYWVWLVLAVPGIIKAIQTKASLFFEMGIALMCLLFCFWFMSTSLGFYNPIHLNPRHLIILIPPASVLIAYGSDRWTEYKTSLLCLFILGLAISLLINDWKMGAYLAAFTLVFFMVLNKRKSVWAILVFLIIPVIYSIYYQYQNKNYNHFKSTLNKEIQKNDNQNIIYINSFVFFGKNWIISPSKSGRGTLKNIETVQEEEMKNSSTFHLLVYKYYLHAYPEETEFLKRFQHMAKELGFEEELVQEDRWIKISKFQK